MMLASIFDLFPHTNLKEIDECKTNEQTTDLVPKLCMDGSCDPACNCQPLSGEVLEKRQKETERSL
jgi:hypothetical protein